MINSFVNFIGNRINPAVVNAYVSSDAYDADDFFGADSSTGNYTKAGYMLAVYIRMQHEGNDMTGVEDALDIVLDLTIDEVENRNVLGRDGDGIMAQAIYSNQNVSTALYEDMYTKANPTSGLFSTLRETGLFLKLIDRELTVPANVVVGRIDGNGSDLAVKSANQIVSKHVSELMFSFLKLSEMGVSGTDYTQLALVITAMKLVIPTGYNSRFGANPAGSSDPVTNDIIRVINGSGHDITEHMICTSQMLTSMLTEASTITNIRQGYSNEIPGSLLRTTSFSSSSYGSSISEQLSGYSPLIMYISKYASSSRKEVVAELAKYFCPFAISVNSAGGSEGFNAIGLAAYHCRIINGAFSGDLVDSVKGWLSSVKTASDETPSGIYLWYISGCVSIFSEGSSNNSFGAITNILDKVVAYHTNWQGDHEEGTSFSDIYPVLVAGVFPESLDYEFYQLWSAEFGITIE